MLTFCLLRGVVRADPGLPTFKTSAGLDAGLAWRIILKPAGPMRAALWKMANSCSTRPGSRYDEIVFIGADSMLGWPPCSIHLYPTVQSSHRVACIGGTIFFAEIHPYA